MTYEQRSMGCAGLLQAYLRIWSMICKHDSIMKYLKVSLFICFLLWGSGCKTAPANSPQPTPPENQINLEQDKACRETIQKLYTIETYCPNNIDALQSLYSDSFNQDYPPTLERCQNIQSYKIHRLLSSNESGFPSRPTYTKPADVLEYFVEIEIEPQPGMSIPGNNPSYIWLQMRINESGQCKVDDLSGGG